MKRHIVNILTIAIVLFIIAFGFMCCGKALEIL